MLVNNYFQNFDDKIMDCLLETYIQSINRDLIKLDIGLIYPNCTYSEILSRMYNQLVSFESTNLSKIKIADIGSGLGIHANYLRLKGANVTCYEPNTNYSKLSKYFFPELNVKNKFFDYEKYDIITLFGGVYHLMSEKINRRKIFYFGKLIVIDLYPNPDRKECEEELSEEKLVFQKVYYDEVRKRDRLFRIYEGRK